MIKWVLVFLCFAVGWLGTMGVIVALQLLNQHDKIEKLEDDMNRTDKNISYLSKIIALDNEHITKSRKGIKK